MLSKCSIIIIIAVCLVCCCCQRGSAFSICPHKHHSHVIKTSSLSTHLSASPSQHHDDGSLSSRREWAKNISTIIATSSIAILTSSNPNQALAASDDTIWKTGKAPIVPGQKQKDKGDTKGTKKDPNFLRSIADCKGKCENSPGPDGLARSSTECLASCQDICCTTYEQCTFNIVPR